LIADRLGQKEGVATTAASEVGREELDALVVYNPTAGPRDVRRELDRVIGYLERRGWRVALRETTKTGDATLFAQEAVAARCKAIFVAGGDGTINEVVNGLVGSSVAMGVLPVGTGNVWAKELGLPTYTLTHPGRLVEAAQRLSDGDVRWVDVGRAGSRYFLLWGGVGIDAEVTFFLEPRPRRTKRLGALAYLVAGLMVARDFQGVRTTLIVDDRIIRTRTILILVSNIQLYGGLVRITPEARLDDGLLDVRIFKGVGFRWVLRHLIGVFTSRHLRDPKVVYFRGRRVAVYTAEPTPVQVDGEPIGTTPILFEVIPRALRVLVPRDVSPRLFCHGVDGRLAFTTQATPPPRFPWLAERLTWVREMTGWFSDWRSLIP